MKTTLIAKIAMTLNAYQNCVKNGNTEWKENHFDVLMQIQNKFLPSGSGIDCGTKINIEESTNKKIIFSFEFHHMKDGYYDGWTKHDLIVTPAFDGIDMRITGRNKNDIKDYLYDTFDSILTEEIEWDNVKF